MSLRFGRALSEGVLAVLLAAVSGCMASAGPESRFEKGISMAQKSQLAVAGLKRTFGRASVDRRHEAVDPSVTGAHAALETFYAAFNQRSLEGLQNIWAQDEHVSLNNPLGGVITGLPAITELYRNIFEGPARVWVELYDIVEYAANDTVVFAGRERGEFSREGRVLELAIRTTRIFHYFGPETGWRQVHHHGSIDNAEELSRYQLAVRGSAVAPVAEVVPAVPASALVFVINIHDAAMYREYRSRIAPLLKRYSVVVKAEYQVAQTLHSDAEGDRVNRLAVFLFPSASTRETFFQDPDYLAAKPLLQASTRNLSRLIP